MKKNIKLKNALLTTLSFVLVAAVAIGATLAYLTSTDDDVNVMTLGNVSIAQHEYQRAEGVGHINSGAQEGDLVTFVQGQPLYPAVPTADDAYEAEQAADRCFNWGVYSPGWNGLWDDSKLANVMDKFVFVENTGKSDAYYRTLIALECPEGMTIGYSGDDEINVNINGGSRFTWDYSVGHVTIEGTRYEVWSATYNEILAPGEVSRPSLLQVVMTHNATNEDMELLGDTYDILVLSQAVQAAGFDSSEAALTEGFGEITDANVTTWFEEMLIARNTITATTPEEVLEAFENAQPGMTINAEGVTLVPTKDPNNTVNIPAGVTVKGVTFAPNSNAFLRIGEGSDPVVFENCDFPGASMGTYLIGTDGCADVTFIKCDFKGFLQPNGTENTDAVFTFDNCTFGLSDGTGYVNCMGGTYNFNDCTFDFTGGATFGSNQYVKWNAVNSFSESSYATTVNMNNCTFINCSTYKVGPSSTLTVQ